MTREGVADVIAFVTLPLVAISIVGAILIAIQSLIWFLALAAWVVLFGTIGALIAPRKGLSPGDGFLTSAIFGIFGVAYIALRSDEAPGEGYDDEDAFDDEDELESHYPDPVAQIRRLGELRDSGLLTVEEFDATKSQLLRRL